MKLTICGDVCPRYTNDLFVRGEKDILFNDVPNLFAGSHRVLVNLETALTESENKIKKFGPNIKSSPACAKLLREIGVTDCGISNNHFFDYGKEGVRDTVNALKEAGLNYTGFGDNYEDARKNLIIEKDGISVAVISVCEHEYNYALENRMGARGYDPYDTIADIRKAKSENDYVVVTYHGGKEQCVYPSPRLRKVCRAMVKNGADVVLCQHSHCIGSYEEYEGGHILYGQGNFHFVPLALGQNPQWYSGLIVQLEMSDRLDIEFIPVKVLASGIEIAKGEDAENIMNLFKQQSDHLHNGKWLEGWREFCEASRERYIGAIANAYKPGSTAEDNDYFAHNLYCEAHRDVWMELCKLSWETRDKI